jgi:hypothetical protein
MIWNGLNKVVLDALDTNLTGSAAAVEASDPFAVQKTGQYISLLV